MLQTTLIILLERRAIKIAWRACDPDKQILNSEDQKPSGYTAGEGTLISLAGGWDGTWRQDAGCYPT